MSVHSIYYKEGRKHMRPVLTREEYNALRDSEKNLKAIKKYMVQMNYSCLPNEDGSLRGSKRMTSTVAMDIDLTPEENEKEAQTLEIQNRILAQKDALGLLMLEKSATKGYHTVFLRRQEMSQEQNIRWAADLLGVPFDDNALDITRVFYTPPTANIVYLDDKIFEVEEVENTDLDCHNDKTKADVKDDNRATPKATCDHIEPATAFSLNAFDLCVENAGLKQGEMDIWGQHNWHANLMAVMSVGLPKLMSREQLLAVVAERLPNYSKTQDCRNLIDYFYDTYTADKGFMNVTLRNINAQAQQLAVAQPTTEEDEAADEREMDFLTKGWAPPVLPRKIPRILELLVRNYDPRFREMLLMAALPVLSAHASHFRATYLSGKVVGPNQYVAVIGGSGSGKDNCTKVFDDCVKYTIEAHDNAEMEKVRQNTEMRDKMANAKDRPAKYHPSLRIFETASKTSILELQTNLGTHGMLLGKYSEVDALTGLSRAAYSDISVILRKGWDIDTHRQYYMSEASCNTATPLSISLLMAGTPRAMLERLFSDNNCEGGFMQRCIPVLVPKGKRTFRPPKMNFLTDDEKKERDALIMDLYQKDLSLGDDTLMLDTPMTNRAIGEWFDELEERYNDGNLTEAEADLSRRCGEFMLRAAIPLIALYGKETKEIVAFARWVGEMAHYNLSRIFGPRVQREIVSANELLTPAKDARKTIEPLLSKLPEVFTTKEIRELRIREGQSSDVKTLLCRYCANGKLEKVAKGVYRKTGTGKA